MSTLQDRFLLLRSKKPEITNADLARLTGAKPPSVGDWFNGQTKTLKADTASKAAKVYGVSAMWLATGDGEMVPPHLAAQQAGNFSVTYSNVPPADGPDLIVPGATITTKAPIIRPQAMGDLVERRLTRFLAVLFQLPESEREKVLLEAIENALDHFPAPPPTA